MSSDDGSTQPAIKTKFSEKKSHCRMIADRLGEICMGSTVSPKSIANIYQPDGTKKFWISRRRCHGSSAANSHRPSRRSAAVGVSVMSCLLWNFEGDRSDSFWVTYIDFCDVTSGQFAGKVMNVWSSLKSSLEQTGKTRIIISSTKQLSRILQILRFWYLKCQKKNFCVNRF